MHVFVNWSEVIESLPSSPSFLAHLKTTPLDQSAYSLIESFVTERFHIVVLLNAVPIQSFCVYVYSTCAQNIASIGNSYPHSLHFGTSFKSCHEWNQPRDLFFQACATQRYFCAYHAFLDHSDLPSSISFVIRLSDSHWVRDYQSKDFLVGSVASAPPSCVEVPLSWPLSPNFPSKILSLHRENPFWLVPHYPTSLIHCMDETFFILARIESTTPPLYCALMLCVDSVTGLRSSAFPVPSFGIAVRIESGLRYPIKLSQLDNSLVAAISCNQNPYQAVRQLIQILVRTGVNFSSRLDKIASPQWISRLSDPLLSSLGYCTWDAFGTNISRRACIDTVKWLQQVLIPVGYSIVDDGWQAISDITSLKQFPHLVNLRANERFNHSLDSVIADLGIPVYAWVNILGYWGGLSTADFNQFSLTTVNGIQARGLHRNNVGDVHIWEKSYSVLRPDPANLSSFFNTYFHENISCHQKISGLKIDGQSLLDALCGDLYLVDPFMTRLKLITLYREAMAKVVRKAFPNSFVLNCMSCGPEAIFSSGSCLTLTNVCWRMSNDHAFPGVTENPSAVAWHILSNSMNTLLLGELFPIPDWDMFSVSSNDRLAKLHAVARVISGGPIYFSDATPFSNKSSHSSIQLLQSLVSPDGHIIRCHDIGRPTVDSLFINPMHSETVFKVSNRNAVNAILAMFNLRTGYLEQGKEESINGSFRPSDIMDFDMFGSNTSYLSLIVQDSHLSAYFHRHKNDELSVIVDSLHTAMIHICPVFAIEAGIEMCAIGQPDLLNCGGVISSVAYTSFSRKGQYQKYLLIEIDLKSSGETLIWLNFDKCRFRVSFLTSEGSILSTSEAFLDGLLFTTIRVPKQKPYRVTVRLSTIAVCERSGL